jgi:RNA polymerase sigma factor (sigma-70 family)
MAGMPVCHEELPRVNPTSQSLLDRLKQPQPDAADWRRLHDLYQPLIRQWLARISGLGDEADDLAQEVLVVVVRELPKFERRREGSFRAWLRQIMVNRVRTFRKLQQRRPRTGLDSDGEDFLARLEDPASDLSRQWDREHDRHVFQKLLDTVRGDFEQATWEAFQRFAVEGRPAAQVAKELGVSENAVLQAKSHILKRLRAEAGDFLD